MKAWVFDVDGVLTDPEKKQAAWKLLVKLEQILEKGDILSLNTGRSIFWVKDRILTPLIEQVKDPTLFKNMFIVCEKGNSILSYESGSWKEMDNTSALPPLALSYEIKKMVEEFSAMFFDESKKTMVTVEMKDGFDNREFTRQQKIYVDKVEKLLEKKYEELSLRIDSGQIATDIQDKDAGKHKGAIQIKNWMDQNSLKPVHIYMFGDTKSDIEMAEELQDAYPVTFVFVNEVDKLELGNKKTEFKIVYTKEKFDRGTLEYLNTNL